MSPAPPTDHVLRPSAGTSVALTPGSGPSAGPVALAATDPVVLHGDAVMETLLFAGGRLLRRDAHLGRLVDGCRSQRIPAPSMPELTGLLDAALAGWPPATPAAVRLLVGAPADDGPAGTALATVSPLAGGLLRERTDGIRVLTLTLPVSPSTTWRPPVKTTSMAAAFAARRHARERGADDVVWTDGDGVVLEGATSACAWVSGGRLISPPAGRVLPSLTLAAVEAVAPALGLTLAREDATTADLAAADEVLLLSTLRRVAPVVAVDGRPVGAGRPGPWTTALAAALDRADRLEPSVGTDRD